MDLTRHGRFAETAYRRVGDGDHATALVCAGVAETPLIAGYDPNRIWPIPTTVVLADIRRVNHQYVNCWQNYPRFKALYSILGDPRKTIDIHRQSTPRDELLDRLEGYDGPPCVVILDEADRLEDKRVFYDVHALPRFSMLLIANDEKTLFAGVDERLTSRIPSCERIRFDRYTIVEPTAILDTRAWSGEHRNMFSCF